MSIYVQHEGKQLGPFTEAEIKAQLASGAISLQDHIWWEGQKDWAVLSQTPYGGSIAPGVSVVPGTAAAAAYSPGVIAPTSQLAIWALVCGCLSLLCGIFASIPAIILGHMGLKETKQKPDMQGHGMALAGVILGYVFTAIFTLYLGIVVISVLIALGNQVKSVTPQSKIEQSTNSADQTTISPRALPADSNTPPPTVETTTNSAPASTNSPDSSTSAAPMSQ